MLLRERWSPEHVESALKWLRREMRAAHKYSCAACRGELTYVPRVQQIPTKPPRSTLTSCRSPSLHDTDSLVLATVRACDSKNPAGRRPCQALTRSLRPGRGSVCRLPKTNLAILACQSDGGSSRLRGARPGKESRPAHRRATRSRIPDSNTAPHLPVHFSPHTPRSVRV
jgi:hypothetical protein